MPASPACLVGAVAYQVVPTQCRRRGELPMHWLHAAGGRCERRCTLWKQSAPVVAVTSLVRMPAIGPLWNIVGCSATRGNWAAPRAVTVSPDRAPLLSSSNGGHKGGRRSARAILHHRVLEPAVDGKAWRNACCGLQHASAGRPSGGCRAAIGASVYRGVWGTQPNLQYKGAYLPLPCPRLFILRFPLSSPRLMGGARGYVDLVGVRLGHRHTCTCQLKGSPRLRVRACPAHSAPQVSGTTR